MQPLVSIIIPVYHQAYELGLALDSIQKQTYPNIEIIVIDDDGDQGVMDIVETRENITIYQQTNQGAPVARNKGFELSKGEYIIFWDADIVAKPEMIEKMVKKLEEEKDINFVYCSHYFGFKKMPAKKFSLNALKNNNYIHTTSLVRREAVVKWDEDLGRFQDWDFWLTLSEKGNKGVWLNEYLFRIISKGTMSSWLPSFAYKKPWKWLPGIRKKVKKYEISRQIIKNKHSI